MTEDKRFGVIPNWCVYEKIDEVEKYLTFDETVTILNQLNDENEQLKSKNRGLQSELQIFKEDVTHSNLQINKLAEENEQLKAQLYCNHNDGVCSICKHCYLEEQSYYYISKCEKGHEQCSKEAVKYCEDFEIKGDIE